MSDNPVSNVSRIDPASIQVSQVQASQVQDTQAQANQIQGSQAQGSQTTKDATATKAQDGVKKETSTEQTKKVAGTENTLGRKTNLKFHVDPKTHEVTVWIMDRATNKVVSTIPPNKIKDVPPGDLLEYTA